MLKLGNYAIDMGCPLNFRAILSSKFRAILSSNSASCERVFSLVKIMFGEQQMSALADYIRAALMLKFNQRTVAECS